MLPARLLFRTAGHLRAAWDSTPEMDSAALGRSLDCLRRDYLALQDARSRVVKATRHGLSFVVPELEAELSRSAGSLLETLTQVQESLQHRPKTERPSAASLIADLRQLEDEFQEVKVHGKQRAISVTTEPIQLEGVNLGSFAIKFNWDRHDDGWTSNRFDIIALDPNPASSNEDVTHPHVKYQVLCAGDAKAAIKRALQDGRLADAFILVRSVLMTYNRDSAHVTLAAWHDQDCYDCGTCLDDDELWSCDRCAHHFCSDCIEECTSCHGSRCTGCMGCCAVCKQPFCESCLQTSAHSPRKCCRSCSTPCPHCQQPVAKSEVHGPQGCPAQQSIVQSTYSTMEDIDGIVCTSAS